MAMVRYPLPITPAMLAPANPRVDYPRYNTPADWNMGVTGNDRDVAKATSPKVGAEATTATAIPPITPANPAAKAAALVPPGQIVADIGFDYGTYAGQAGRTGTITPQTPYPDVNSPPAVLSVTPNTGLAAGGTSVTIVGRGFTGATGVTFGGTAATAVTVVDSHTITCTSPAKAAGTYDVRVTTPKGTSPIAGAADNFVYT
jgi:IPT/TIG domain